MGQIARGHRKLAGVAVSVAMGAGLCCVLTRTAAAFPSSRLVYERGPGAESCPGQAEIRAAVAERLGYDPFFPSADKTIVARITREGATLSAQVELIDEHGNRLGLRELQGESGNCAELSQAVALSISIAIDPHSGETYAQGPVLDGPEPDAETAPEYGPSKHSSEPSAAAPLGSHQTEPTASTHPARPAPRVVRRVFLGAGVVASLGDAPRPVLGLRALGGVRREQWSVSLEGLLELPVTQQFADGRAARTQSYGLTLAPCRRLADVVFCALGTVGRFQARGTEPDARSGDSLLLGLGGRVGVELPLGSRWSLRMQGDLSWNPAPARIEYQRSELWRAPAANGNLSAALLYFL